MGAIIIGLIGMAAFILGVGGCLEVFSAIKDKKVKAEIRSKNDLLLYLVMLILCTSYLAYDVYRYETMIPDGTYCHYAIVSADYGSYYLPSRVYKSSDTSEIESGYDYISGERKTTAITTSAYYISEAYWSNGGYLRFEEDVPMVLGEKYTLHDQDWEEWTVTITEERTTHPKVTERVEEKDWLGYGIDIFVMSGGIIGSLLVLIKFFKSSGKDDIL